MKHLKPKKLLTAITFIAAMAFLPAQLAAQDGKTETDKKNLLEGLGFALTPPASATDGTTDNPYGNGYVQLAPEKELRIFQILESQDKYDRILTYNYKYSSSGISTIIYDNVYTYSRQAYSKVYAGNFSDAPANRGKLNELAKLTMDRSHNVFLIINNLEKKLFTLPGTAITESLDIRPLVYRGLLVAAVGNFTGESGSQIAVYNPVASGGAAIEIYSYASFPNNTPLCTIKLPVTNTTYADESWAKLPAVSMAVGDLSGDGRDDLVVTINVHGRDRAYDASRLAIFHSKYEKGALTFTSVSTPEYRKDATSGVNYTYLQFGPSSNTYTLNAAGVAIGDINGDGAKEIIVSGLVRKSNSDTDCSNWMVAANASNDDYFYEATTYFNGKGEIQMGEYGNFNYTEDAFFLIKGKRKFSHKKKSGNYTFPLSNCYQAPLSIVTYKQKGIGFPEAVRTQSHILNLDDKGKFTSADGWYPANADKNGFCWIEDVAAGNFNGDKGGKETIALTCVEFKPVNKTSYTSLAKVYLGSTTLLNIDNWAGGVRCFSLAPTVDNNRSPWIKYKSKEYYFSNPNILAVLQAAPTYGELNYSGGVTTISNSTGSGQSQNHSVSVSAGCIWGIDASVPLVGGPEMESSLTLNVGYAYQGGNKTTSSIIKDSGDDEDRVILSMVPYTKYLYDMYLPESQLMTQAEYNIKTGRLATLKSKANKTEAEQDEIARLTDEIKAVDEARNKGIAWGGTVPAKMTTYELSIPGNMVETDMTIDQYEKVAKKYGYELIYDNILPKGYKLGKPGTYRKDTNGLDVVLMGAAANGKTDEWSTISNSGSSFGTTRLVETESESSHGVTWGVAFETSVKVKLGPAVIGGKFGLGYNGGYTWSTTSGKGYSGRVVNTPKTVTDYKFDWNFFVHKRKMANKSEVFVLEYLVKEPTSPLTVVPGNLGITAPVQGQTPATSVNTNGNLGYTASIAWDGNPTTFAGSTVYTATITLTANPNYLFKGMMSDEDLKGFTINGSSNIKPVFVSNTNGKTLVIKVTFDKTGVAPLVFTNSSAFNIPPSWVDENITSINVSGAVSGGTSPYTFSATNLPAGITISTAGVISGKPTAVSAAGKATITVKDNNNNVRTIEITYGEINARVKSVPIEVRQPVGGEAASSFISHKGTGFTATVSWGSVTTFVLGTWYEATITLTAMSGYSFDDFTSTAAIKGFTVNGVEPTFRSKTSSTLTFSVQFQAGVLIVNIIAPAITTQPKDLSVTVGSSAVLSVTAVKYDNGTLSYQWYKVGSPDQAISGATSASYTVPTTAELQAQYYVVVKNTDNSLNGTKTASVNSQTVTVSVTDPLKCGLIFYVANGKFYFDVNNNLRYDASDVEYTGQTGKWSYGDGILKLNGFVWETATRIALKIEGDVTLDITGANSFKSTYSGTEWWSAGIDCNPGSLNICGTGTLNAEVGSRASGQNVAIYAAGNLKIGSGTVNAVGCNTSYGYGIGCSGTFSILGGTLTAQGGWATFCYNAANSQQLSESYDWTKSANYNGTGATSGSFPSVAFSNSDNPKYVKIQTKVSFCGGDGSIGNPYLICNAKQLDGVRLGLDKHYKLNNDIDLIEFISENDHINGWEPIGSTGTNNRFTGSFDGANHKITGLWIDRSETNDVGLFGNTNGATISNLGVEIAPEGVKGRTSVGGLIGGQGINYTIAKISNCYVTGNVTGTGSYVGGLIGYLYGTLENCYALASVEGTSTAGGLVGINFDNSTISNCYAAGNVTGSTAGGLVGNNTSTASISNSFFDTQTTGQTNGVGSGSQTGVTGKTTAQMQAKTTFTGWNFTTVWGICEGTTYPFLQWQKVKCDFCGGIGTAGNPYLICNATQLNAVRDGLDRHYKLKNDIDLTAFIQANDNVNGWLPIGTTTTRFTGSFNGAGHKITGLWIDRSSTNDIGLFGNTDGATIENVGVEIAAKGVKGRASVGGLVGGQGINYSIAKISNCYVTGNVTGTSTATGGLIGYLYGTLENCYATGNVTGITAGGLVGNNFNNSTIINCYAAGNVTGSTVGGLVGNNTSTASISNCFFNTQTAGTTNGVGSGSQDGVTGKTTAQMRVVETFTGAFWDFDIWGICKDENSGYPFLRWQGLKDCAVYTLTFTGTVTATKVYNGNANFTNAQITVNNAGSFSGLVGSDVITLSKTGVTGTLSSANVGSGNLTLSGSFTLSGTNAARYILSAQPTVVATITKAAGVFGTPAAIATTYTPTLKLSDLTLPAGYAWVTPTTAITAAGNGQTFPATFTDPSGNYNAANGNITVNVAKAAGTFGTPAAINTTYTPTLKLSDLTLPAGYAWVTPTTAITAASNGQTFPATFTDPSGNYNAANGNITVNVAKATPAAIVWATASTITYGAELSTSTLTGGSTNGTFAWTDGTIVPTVTNFGYSVTFTPADINNYDWAGITLTEIIPIIVNKAEGDFGNPAAIDVDYIEGLTLSDLTLPDGYTWDDPTTELNAGEGQTFPATYTDPSGNYEEVNGFITVNVAGENGVVETWRAASVTIYPNPVKDELRIKSEELRINNVEICNIAGRIVLAPSNSPKGGELSPPYWGGVGGGAINVSALPTGIYLVKIYTDKGIVTQKFIKE